MYSQTNRLIPVLACADRTLKVLDRSNLLHNVEVNGTPTVLHLNGNDGGEVGDEVLYGTSDGKVGLIRVGRYVSYIRLNMYVKLNNLLKNVLK